MRIALVNPPHSAIGSRIPDEQLPPLGLLAVGGPLLDDGHVVRLIDADREDLPDDETLARIRAFGPDLVLLGHSGSTSAHPVAARITRKVREEMPHVVIVYGGVFPTYHHRDVLRQELRALLAELDDDGTEGSDAGQEPPARPGPITTRRPRR